MTARRPIWLDITRLVERACLGALTGIDRVELAYAETLLALAPDRIRFALLGRVGGRLSLVTDRSARRFVADLRLAWTRGQPRDCRVAALRMLCGGAFANAAHDPSAIYVMVSHRHLHRPTVLSNALRHAGVRFVPMIHDLIPLEFPEYGRPGEAERHRRRVAAVAALADGVLVNSTATRTALQPYLPPGLPMHAAPLGVGLPAAAAPETSARPYMLCVGTIEPRKNHLLLLNLWRRLVQLHGAATPTLVLVGQRGWENENVVDMLDRCEAIRPHLSELGSVSDVRLSALLKGARALLMPSFAEGFGLPVAEALAHGTPGRCSDLPALREAGGSVPEYLDPLDSLSWQTAVMDYTEAHAARRQAQLSRMDAWQRTGWDSHVQSVLPFLDTLQGSPRRSWPTSP